MSIREKLLQEPTLQNIKNIAASAGSSQTCLAELMQCFLSNEYRVAQRAAAVVIQVAAIKPAYIQTYIGDLVTVLSRKEVHPAVVRNSIRILQQVDISIEYHGDVMNSCFHFIEDPDTPVAIKAFSLTTLDNLSKIYPDIRQELKTIISARWDTESAAFRSRGRKILQTMVKHFCPSPILKPSPVIVCQPEAWNFPSVDDSLLVP